MTINLLDNEEELKEARSSSKKANCYLDGTLIIMAQEAANYAQIAIDNVPKIFKVIQ